MAKVIHTFLYGDTLDSSRLVTIDTCVCRLYHIKRGDNATLSQLGTDITKPALYILLNREAKKAYIGQTDNFRKRLGQHEKIHFWTEALGFISSDDSLHLTLTHYLEAIAYELAKKAGTYDVSKNAVTPSKPNTSAQQHIFLAEQFFEYVRFLTQFVGCNIFGDDKPIPKAEHLFFCTRAGSNAQGYFVEETEEFVVLAGSELRSGECDSLKPKSIDKRKAFIEANCSQSKGKITLKADYTFPSPSAAAAMVVGGSSNGWTRWKDADGKTLSEVYRSK
jgi:predicted GIY-YIG superfamily endonuclease